MTARIIFPRAPITEALVDLKVNLPTTSTLDVLASFHEAIKDRYPNKRERISWKGGVQIKGGRAEVIEPQGGPDGYFFTSLDGKQIVQARLDGFTFNRLKPYDRWESFREEARELWKLYVRVAGPKEITRAALRYINRIEIPLPMRDFKDYIVTVPEIAPDLPQGLERFLMQLSIPMPEIDATAVITETIEPVTDPTKLPLIFDIDVFKQASFDVDGEKVWEAFEQLHDLKNDVFFKSITDKAKELFQ